MGDQTYQGTCFCGAVELEVTGAPEAQGFCHCTSCRQWAAAPVNAFTLWKPDQVEVKKGEDQIGVYNKTERSYRKYCRKCGGHLMTDHPQWQLVDVYAGIIPDFPYQPQVHVNYGEKVLSIGDGLPKFKDVPAEMGGSGETLPE